MDIVLQNPEVEAVYVFKFDSRAPICNGYTGRIKVTVVRIEFSEDFIDITVSGRKLLKNGEVDERSRYNQTVAFEATIPFRRAWNEYADQNGIVGPRFEV